MNSNRAALRPRVQAWQRTRESSRKCNKNERKLIMKNRNITFTAILAVLSCFAVWPDSNAFGVVPAPDGGYSGANTAEGQNALLSLTTGGYNTAVGFLALRSNTEGLFNTGTGAGALLSNIIGVGNTATGAFALFNNITGGNNTAIGARALEANTTGT